MEIKQATWKEAGFAGFERSLHDFVDGVSGILASREKGRELHGIIWEHPFKKAKQELVLWTP
jgi:hypothetical protein